MKKFIFLLYILTPILCLGQNVKFENIYSTKDLIQIQKSVLVPDKHSFYTQFIKATLFENIKEKFTYKSYSDKVLKEFVRAIIQNHQPNKTEKFETLEVPMTYKEYVEDEIKNNIARKSSDSLLKSNPLLKSFVESTEENIPKKTANLKVDYEYYLKELAIRNDENPYLEKNRLLTIKQLDDQFRTGQYFTEDTEELLNRNLEPYLIMPISFHNITTSNDVESEDGVTEIIAGEIIAYTNNKGTAASVNIMTFQIKNDILIPIDVLPTLKKSFYRQLDKNITSLPFLQSRAGYTLEKETNGFYIIATSLFLAEDALCCPSNLIKYQTKNFKKFYPIKIEKVVTPE